MEPRTSKWSDGRIRSDSYHGSELDIAIMKYFEDRNEEEHLKYLWDNEAMKRERHERPVEVAKAAAA